MLCFQNIFYCLGQFTHQDVYLPVYSVFRPFPRLLWKTEALNSESLHVGSLKSSGRQVPTELHSPASHPFSKGVEFLGKEALSSIPALFFRSLGNWNKGCLMMRPPKYKEIAVG